MSASEKSELLLRAAEVRLGANLTFAPQYGLIWPKKLNVMTESHDHSFYKLPHADACGRLESRLNK